MLNDDYLKVRAEFDAAPSRDTALALGRMLNQLSADFNGHPPGDVRVAILDSVDAMKAHLTGEDFRRLSLENMKLRVGGTPIAAPIDAVLERDDKSANEELLRAATNMFVDGALTDSGYSTIAKVVRVRLSIPETLAVITALRDADERAA